MTGDLAAGRSEADSDLAALEAGYITITPLHYDLTNYSALDTIRKWRFDRPFWIGDKE
jgi:5'-nucleotidase